MSRARSDARASQQADREFIELARTAGVVLVGGAMLAFGLLGLAALLMNPGQAEPPSLLSAATAVLDPPSPARTQAAALSLSAVVLTLTLAVFSADPKMFEASSASVGRMSWFRLIAFGTALVLLLIQVNLLVVSVDAAIRGQGHQWPAALASGLSTLFICGLVPLMSTRHDLVRGRDDQAQRLERLKERFGHVDDSVGPWRAFPWRAALLTVAVLTVIRLVLTSSVSSVPVVTSLAVTAIFTAIILLLVCVATWTAAQSATLRITRGVASERVNVGFSLVMLGGLSLYVGLSAGLALAANDRDFVIICVAWIAIDAFSYWAGARSPWFRAGTRRLEQAFGGKAIVDGRRNLDQLDARVRLWGPSRPPTRVIRSGRSRSTAAPTSVGGVRRRR